jgi:hypothetical protein
MPQSVRLLQQEPLSNIFLYLKKIKKITEKYRTTFNIVFAIICEAFLSCERPGVGLPREVRLLADETGKSGHGAEVELLLLRSREVQLEGMGGGEGVARGGRRRRGRRSRTGRPHVTEGSEGLLVPT